MTHIPLFFFDNLQGTGVFAEPWDTKTNPPPLRIGHTRPQFAPSGPSPCLTQALQLAGPIHRMASSYPRVGV